MRKRKHNPFKHMSRKELVEYCRRLYETSGISALSYSALSKHRGLYMALYVKGLKQRTLLKALHLGDEYKKHATEQWVGTYNGRVIRRWTWNRILEEARSVTNQLGFLPPAAWFEENGKGGFVQAVYNLGKTWGDLYSEFGHSNQSSFVQSRNGLRWRSVAEASLSNFLYARGIKHSLGGKYPDQYRNYSGMKYGYYDLSFLSRRGHWIDVEIWGDKPYGHDEKQYRRKRLIKEAFNRSNRNFLGMHYRDCYNEGRLTHILKPYVGVITPYVFDKPYDQEIPSTHWVNADELIEHCRKFADQQPGGVFPTEEWLRKRGKWKNREGAAYNTLSVYIKTWIGGIRQLRRIIGQAHNSTEKWDCEKALAALKDWRETYGCSPATVVANFMRGKLGFSRDQYRRAACIAAAVRKHVGSMRLANEVLGYSDSKVR